MVKKYLDEAYRIESGQPAELFYDSWAESYDEELAEAGYVAPTRCAQALARATAERARPVLDLGCGTGLSGVALRSAGFTAIDGWEPSAEMIRRAEARDVYRVLRQIEPDRPLTGAQGAYCAIVAVGVMGPGHAPASAIGECLALLPAGGLLVFTLNDVALADGAHLARVEAAVEAGAARLLSRVGGPHIPAIRMNSDVLVLQKP